jgi:hypothetical protein
MKKVLTIALAAVTLMVMVSCGASPHPARKGFTEGVENVIEGAIQVNGRAPDFAYYTSPANSREDLNSPTEGKINLLGFYSYDFSDTIKNFQIIVVGYEATNGCEAELYVIDEYSDNNAMVFYSTSCSNSTGYMNMTFDGGGSSIRLTGQSTSQALTFVTIEDTLFYPTKFTDNRKFYNAVTATQTTR